MGGNRARLSRKIADADAIRLFAEYHIVQVRRRKNGEILHVKHATFGWISPQAYYALQEIHAILPKIVEGGYRMKAALWSLNVEVAGFSIPLGLLFPAIEGIGLTAAIKDGNWLNAAFWSYALLGPFGDILAVIGIAEFLGATTEKLADLASEARKNSILPPIQSLQ